MRIAISGANETALIEHRGVEVVERKGLGHPDTICDLLAEEVSRALLMEYVQSFGQILHYNVDKALLRGGRSRSAFGGGTIDEPMEFYLCGRAQTELKDRKIDLDDLVRSTCQGWLAKNLHALDVNRHILVHNLVRPGSVDLNHVFSQASHQGLFLANDTSYGVGFAPLSSLERLVIALEKELITQGHAHHPEIGEDIKIMAVRRVDRLLLTIACAFVDRTILSLADYLQAKDYLHGIAAEVCQTLGFENFEIKVNSADDLDHGKVYTTVTGTSAECGDDGQVGRGNRFNGLITPSRPMSLEATAGKNPITHTGKIYNRAATAIATAIWEEVEGIKAAECCLVSQIGSPIHRPMITEIRAVTHDGQIQLTQKLKIQEIVTSHLEQLNTLSQSILTGGKIL